MGQSLVSKLPGSTCGQTKAQSELIIDLRRDEIGQAEILPNSTGLEWSLKY